MTAGLADIAGHLAQDGEVIVRFRVIWAKAQGRPITAFRLRHPLLNGAHDAKVEIAAWILRSTFDGRGIGLGGGVELLFRRVGVPEFKPRSRRMLSTDRLRWHSSFLEKKRAPDPAGGLDPALRPKED